MNPNNINYAAFFKSLKNQNPRIFCSLTECLEHMNPTIWWFQLSSGEWKILDDKKS